MLVVVFGGGGAGAGAVLVLVVLVLVLGAGCWCCAGGDMLLIIDFWQKKCILMMSDVWPRATKKKDTCLASC